MNIDELPKEFLDRIKEQLGKNYEAFLSSYEKPYRQALRINSLKGDVTSAQEILDDIIDEPVPWSDDGYYIKEDARPGKSPLHDAGLYYIQEPSAMIVSKLAGARPGEHVLDLCAAPGGKTTALAADMKGKGILVANEIHPARAKILSENVERMGISNCFVTNETPENLAAHFPAFFDKIVVDAPCSGEGMFRKEPAALECWSLSNVLMCADRQKEILKSAITMLSPGGRLIYSTCTFAPEEDEKIVEWLTKNYDVDLVEQHKMYPHEIDGEGHFCAVLQDRLPQLGAGLVYEKTRANNSLKLFNDFAKENIKESAYERLLSDKTFINYGDNLYAAPSGVDLVGLKCLRPGLQLGTTKKDRFEPAHAFALALRGGAFSGEDKAVETRAVADFSLEEAAHYINGETLPAPTGVKGWTLITCCGVSLGFGKASSGIIKNHFPKGLRHN